VGSKSTTPLPPAPARPACGAEARLDPGRGGRYGPPSFTTAGVPAAGAAAGRGHLPRPRSGGTRRP